MSTKTLVAKSLIDLIAGVLVLISVIGLLIGAVYSAIHVTNVPGFVIILILAGLLIDQLYAVVKLRFFVYFRIRNNYHTIIRRE